MEKRILANGKPYAEPTVTDKDVQVRKASRIPRGGHPPDSDDIPYGFGSDIPFFVKPNSSISDLSRKPWDNIRGKPVIRENDYGRRLTPEEIAANNARILKCQPSLRELLNS